MFRCKSFYKIFHRKCLFVYLPFGLICFYTQTFNYPRTHTNRQLCRQPKQSDIMQRVIQFTIQHSLLTFLVHKDFRNTSLAQKLRRLSQTGKIGCTAKTKNSVLADRPIVNTGIVSRASICNKRGYPSSLVPVKYPVAPKNGNYIAFFDKIIQKLKTLI